MNAAPQFLLFCAVGCANTTIDLLFFNLLIRHKLVSHIAANICSTSIAMLFSFFVNRTFVFETTLETSGTQAVAFVVTTLFSSYVIQSFVILHIHGRRRNLSDSLIHVCGLTNGPLANLVRTNYPKLLAVTSGLVWNFTLYRLVVFA
jgi:putative flippase GtrA